MKKHEHVIIQCADCDFKYKKTLKWLENTSSMVCCSCHTTLDVDEVVNEIMLSDKPQEIYTIYQR